MIYFLQVISTFTTYIYIVICYVWNKMSKIKTKQPPLIRDLNVYIVTWNVGTNFPEDINLEGLLGLENASLYPSYSMPDIYAIGLQEVNSQPQNRVYTLFKEDPWTSKVKDILKAYGYVLIKTEQMQGLLLSLFVRREHVSYLKDIEAEFTRTGFGGMWGNKGAVSIRLTIYGSGISFVTAHLAAHDYDLDERVEDYKQILDKHHYHVNGYREIFDHEFVFWFGDLNFRLNGDDSFQNICELINQNQIEDLLQKDQLLLVRNESRAFQQLEENLPTFPPTFKFHEGTANYNPKRRPAWTDRVLFTLRYDKYPNAKLHLGQLSYKSHPAYSISDHKPVTSEFLIKVLGQEQEHSIEFRYFPIWTIGEENCIEYIKPKGFEEKEHDWIGIYRNNFASFNEYISYQYVNQGQDPTIERCPDETASSASFSSHTRQVLQSNPNIIRITFSEDIELNDGENFLLIYFQNTGFRGSASVAGVSSDFRAEKRPHSPRFTSVD